MSPLLSVVVPVYNVEPYIEECIESVVNQSYSNFELLLVDDGSTDNSLSMCKKYASEDSRVKVISQHHSGPFEARKSGVLQSKGDYITFLDADDFIDETSYVLAVNDMENAVDVIVFDILRYFNEEEVRFDTGLLDEKIYTRSEIEHMIFPIMIWDERYGKAAIDPSLVNKVYKADLLKHYYTVSHDIKFHYGEDVAVVYPVLKEATSIAVHHEAYYYHRQRNKGEIAPYIKDEKYMDKLYALYRCLVTDLGEEKTFRKQIDLFYMHSIELVKQKYGIPQNLPDVIFPFDKVNKGEKIVLYGAGNIGRLYMKQLSRCSYCDVTQWVDQNYKQLEECISSPEEIMSADYEKIVIAIADLSIINKVVDYLVNSGVDRDKIVY